METAVIYCHYYHPNTRPHKANYGQERGCIAPISTNLFYINFIFIYEGFGTNLCTAVFTLTMGGSPGELSEELVT